jgi:hypothetical protein
MRLRFHKVIKEQGMDGMMHGGMMWGMMLMGALGILVLILLVAALIKYLFFARTKE